MWRIYYSDRTVTGQSLADWLAAPDTDVQAISLFEPTAFKGWKGIEDGRKQFWTGDDEYRLFDWPVKYGREIPWHQYKDIAERAIADSNTSA